jgi:dethiobiotin synthetase
MCNAGRLPHLRGLFVTGTDTGVGKTVVSAALMHRYRPAASLRYWKPIETGIELDDDTAEVERLGRCAAGELWRSGIRLPRPVSPHLAARLHGTTIALWPLIESLFPAESARSSGTIGNECAAVRWIVEGAGGVLVPINETETMADLMSVLGLPVLVVARSALGTINHTLLTLEALRQRTLHVAGVVMVGDRNAENRAAIERYGDTAVLGEMPPLEPLDPAALEGWAVTELDRERRLLEWLR